MDKKLKQEGVELLFHFLSGKTRPFDLITPDSLCNFCFSLRELKEIGINKKDIVVYTINEMSNITKVDIKTVVRLKVVKIDAIAYKFEIDDPKDEA